MRKLVNRYAGDDPLVKEALDYLRESRLVDDAMAHMENKRQLNTLQDIHGVKELSAYLDPSNPSKTVEQKVARDLLYKGQLPQRLPADSVEAAFSSSNQSGVDGSFQPDSEIRRHVTGGLNSQGDLMIDRSDVRTEVLSPESIERLFNKWKEDSVFGKGGQRQDSRFHFNTAAGEYYGQQMLKASGFKPVSNANRSQETKDAARRGKPSAMGTDRLIENSAGVTSPDTAYSSDYRAIANDGRTVALDYQTGTLNRRDPHANLSIFKNINWENDRQKHAFTDNLKGVAQDLAAAGKPHGLDEIMSVMRDKAMLPDYLSTGYLDPKGNSGVRAGKFLSDAPVMGQRNKNPQHRMEGIMYGLSDNLHRHSQYGMMPQELLYLEANSVRQQLGEHLANNRLVGNISGWYDNKMNWNVPLRSLKAPMDRNYKAQLSTPYTF